MTTQTARSTGELIPWSDVVDLVMNAPQARLNSWAKDLMPIRRSGTTLAQDLLVQAAANRQVRIELSEY